jgi:uncharacterized protein
VEADFEGGTVAGLPRALIVRGGWAGHEPFETTDRLVPLLAEQGFDIEVSGSLETYADAALMRDVDLIVQCWTMGQIAPGQLKGLLSAVSSGTGLTGWHGGLCDAFRNEPEYQFMTGGQWVAHPGGKVDYEVNLETGPHPDPVIAGLEDFRLRSEQYYMHVDPSNIVLATTTFGGTEDAPWTKGCVMPVAWKRTYGGGKIFYSSFGHDAGEFDIPQVREVIVRGAVWASRRSHGLSGRLP